MAPGTASRSPPAWTGWPAWIEVKFPARRGGEEVGLEEVFRGGDRVPDEANEGGDAQVLDSPETEPMEFKVVIDAGGRGVAVGTVENPRSPRCDMRRTVSRLAVTPSRSRSKRAGTAQDPRLRRDPKSPG